MNGKRFSWFSYLAFPLFIAIILLVVFVFRQDFLSILRDRESLRAWILARNGWGEFAFIALQILQVVIFVIPGEIVQVAGGYVFGFWKGSALTLAGITLGSIVNFYAGRFLGRPFVEAIFRKGRIEEIEKVTGSGKAAAGFFLLFVIPGLPKDVLCYVAGVSRLSLVVFIGISMMGRLPGVLGSSFMGSAAFAGSYRAALVVLTVASVLFFLGLFFKEKITVSLARFLHRGTKT
jgi:uncharacterized membrane protein YdjX (TVP38/TMEM64 family)